MDARQRLTATMLGALLVAAGVVAEFLLVVLLGLNCSGSDAGPPSTAPMCDGADLSVVWTGCAVGMIVIPLTGTVATAVAGRARWLVAAAVVSGATLIAIAIAVRLWA